MDRRDCPAESLANGLASGDECGNGDNGYEAMRHGRLLVEDARLRAIEAA